MIYYISFLANSPKETCCVKFNENNIKKKKWKEISVRQDDLYVKQMACPSLRWIRKKFYSKADDSRSVVTAGKWLLNSVAKAMNREFQRTRYQDNKLVVDVNISVIMIQILTLWTNIFNYM